MGSSEAIEAKKVLDHVIVGDIDSKEVLSRIKKLEKFDIIFAAALIEHLHNPWDSLKEWKKFLKKDGKLILSTSNVLHFSQRLKFLQGKFEYTDYGILDNTHLRFFTANTFPRLIKDCGYHVQEVYTDPVGGGYPKLSMLGSLLFPNVFTYQIGIVATS